jgi:hypothetical protein
MEPFFKKMEWISGYDSAQAAFKRAEKELACLAEIQHLDATEMLRLPRLHA